MPRKHPQPFWREARKCWYVQLGGKQIRLDPDRARAFDLYHELMARPAGTAAISRPGVSPTVLEVLDAFLSWSHVSQAGKTHKWHLTWCRAFAASAPKGLTVADLRPHHLLEVSAAHPDWSDSTRNAFIRSIQRAIRWAHDHGLIEANPVQRVAKPAGGRREVVVTPGEFAALLDLFPDREFRDVLITAWETGCRPQELVRVEARHVDTANARWVLPPGESKGKRSARVVYLSDTAAEITRRLCEAHPTGPIFRNMDGRPWTCDAVKLRFQRKARRLGRKLCLYHFRHSFATRMLLAGVDAMVVAHWLGHRDTSMLGRVYGHLSQRPEFLHEKLRAANRPTANGASASAAGEGSEVPAPAP